MRSPRVIRLIPGRICLFTLLLLVASGTGRAEVVRLQSDSLAVEVEEETATWRLLDKRSETGWPSSGKAGPGQAPWLQGRFTRSRDGRPDVIKLAAEKGGTVTFALADGGRALELRYEKPGKDTVRVLADALAIGADEGGYLIVPSREGLLIPVAGDRAFKRLFGTSEYEGCHMSMLGVVKKDSALMVTWDDAYVFPELERQVSAGRPNRLTAAFELRGRATSVRLMPLGRGDWNLMAREYRTYAGKCGYAVTLREKVRRDPHVELMVGASNAKLWTCLARRMNEESTAEESVRVRWTFDEAARIAEHLRNDLKIERCFFMVGGWTEGGYDVRHPDNLPANPECGGNAALADAVQRIQKLGYVGCLHDNVQDMYRDAKSWDPGCIEKKPDGALIAGGRWNGGRAYMVCAPKQLELAQRTQNLGAIRDLFGPWSYFIDTTYAVGPRECFDPDHPIGRNDDIGWKIRLSNYARNLFGTFGSECGREWALPHSDFFEGLVGVSGQYFHQLKPQELGAAVIPFFEMVYHDCQICFGKYGYRAEEAAEYVAHHVLCARPLHYHSFPDHLYWQETPKEGRKESSAERSAYTRSDRGWAAGLHPLDVFLKNTHEVLGPLHEVTAYDRLTTFAYVTGDHSVRRATYGEGARATKVTVNFGPAPVEVASETGGRTVLPPWGFLVEAPRFVAFHARTWNGQDYGTGALFTLRSTDNRDLKDSGQIRVFHAFGPTALSWRGKTCEVEREEVIQPVTP
ncbi:MAG: DUF6259 domain-containing protein [Planctomycetes bacterium]|nr:DUF6259 domain-containing protein [Planctomycetota bacterium]